MSWIIKRMGDTRREREGKVRRTFGPLYQLAESIRADAVDAVQGYPVLRAWGEYMNAGHTLSAFGGTMARVAPDLDLSIFDKVAVKLNAGTPITEDEAYRLFCAVRMCESVYRVTPLQKLRSALLTEQLAIELDEIQQRVAA